jgi:hypothetical protein
VGRDGCSGKIRSGDYFILLSGYLMLTEQIPGLSRLWK